MNDVIKHVHLITVLRNNVPLYYSVLIINILMIYFISILMLVMMIKIKSNKLNIIWPISLLKICLPLYSITFFSQVFLLFITIFDCIQGYAYVNAGIKCRTGLWFKILGPVGIISIILQIFIAIITNSLYFKPIFNNSNSDTLKKINSTTDIIFLFTKIAINIIFSVDKNSEEDHWVVLFFLILFSLLNVYFILFHQNRINYVLIKLSQGFSLILFLGPLSLFIGKIFKYSNFNGLIISFFIFVILIFIYIVIYKTNSIDIILVDRMKINDPQEYLKYISNFYSLINNKNISRNTNINLKILIDTIEENCFDINCPLKLYLLNYGKGIDNKYLILKFLDEIFQYGISKFYFDIKLKIEYTIFLIYILNNKKKALIIFNSIKENASFQIGYNIHIIRNLFKNSLYPTINGIHSLSEYKNNIQLLKELINKTIYIYLKFLTLLLNYRHKSNSNLNEINKIGNKIKNLKKNIENNFELLKENIINNNELFKLYSDFNKIISNDLNDNQLFSQNHNIQNYEIDYSNFEFEIMKEKENKYLIISANKNNIGEIIECSKNLAKILGYTKFEIIGKNINILIPQIFHEKHNLIIFGKNSMYKLDFFEKLSKNVKYKPDLIEKEIYCLAKSNFLVPLKITIYFAETKENEFIYIIKFLEFFENTSLTNETINIKHNNIYKCCILTDKNFLIKTFTLNCLFQLKLNYNYINSNCYIINYIKQFKEDYLCAINNTNISSSIYFNDEIIDEILESSNKQNLSKTIRDNIQKDLINKKYNKKSKITWIIKEEEIKFNKTKIKKKNNFKNSLFKRRNSINSSFTSSSLSINNNLDENNNKNNFYMEVKPIILDNELLGYYFFFSKIDTNENNENLNFNLLSYNKDNNNEQNYNKNLLNINSYYGKNNILNKNIRKVSCEIKIKQNENNSPFIPIRKNDKLSLHYFSSNDLNENYENKELLNINDNFIPKSQINFLFDTKNYSYELSKKTDNNKKLNEYLKKEAQFKFKAYNDKIKLVIENESKSSTITSSSSESDHEIIISNSKPSSDSNSLLYENSKSKKHSVNYGKVTTMKNKLNFRINSNNKFIISKNQMKRNSSFFGNIKDYKIKLEKEQNLIIEKNENYDYYKVDLNKIHFLIYDFNTDILIENKKENISKIEMMLKNNNSLIISKDNTYPIFSFKKNKDKIKNNINQIEEKNDKSRNIIEQDKENSFKNRLNEEINKKEEKISIKRLKKLSFVLFLIIIICGSLFLYFNLTYYYSFNILINLIKNSVILNYCNMIGKYYAKEITLLNFNQFDIIGGVYTVFPAKNKTKYKILLAEKLKAIYIENHEAIKYIFSSKFSPSKNGTKYLSKLFLNISFIFNYQENFIQSDIYETLMQYNNALYSVISTSTELHHNYPDFYTYIFNSNINFEEAIRSLINIFSLELKNEIQNLKIIYIICLILFFFLFISVYIILLKYFLSSIKIINNYMEIFFEIDENLIQNLIYKCQNCLNKNKNFLEIKEDELEDNNDIYIDRRKNIKKNKISIINNKREKIEIKEKTDIKYIYFFGFFILIVYFYFIYNFFYIVKISNKAMIMSQFFFKLQNFDINIMDVFTSYRQFLFDEQTVTISNTLILDYLELTIKKSFDSITSDIIYISEYINKYLIKEEKMIEMHNKSLCSYYFTDYFKSTEECLAKFGIFIKSDFSVFISHFIQEIRVLKNLAIYLLSTGNIRGKLNEFNVNSWMEDDLIPKKNNNENSNTEIMFRFNLFNDELLHNMPNTLFLNIILPYIDENRKVILNISSLEGEDINFIILFCLYIGILLLIFFCYLFQIISYLNHKIYKVKNMLTIIPIDILINENNINILNFLYKE